MRSFLTTAALVGLVAGLPSPNFVVHEKRVGEPLAWTKENRASKSQVLPIRVGLKQSNLDNMYEYVEKVSDPDSPDFGTSFNSLYIIF